MSFTKIARIVGLSLAVAAATLPAFASRPCGCNYCMQNPPATPCSLNGTETTCGDFLIVALCPPQG